MPAHSYPGFVSKHPYASLRTVAEAMSQWMQYLFAAPADEEQFLAHHLQVLEEQQQTLEALLAAGSTAHEAAAAAQAIVDKLPVLVSQLLEDARFTAEVDPAAISYEEVIFMYPGFRAIAYHRFAHLVYAQNAPMLARQIAEVAHAITGIDIHPGAQIGVPFCIDHGTGVVIGETAIIGRRCILYQGVTLGASVVKKIHAHKKRHPTLEDDVVVYANATILGGDTRVGKGAVIGGNCWITQSVPAGHVVLSVAQNEMYERAGPNAPYNFVI